MKFPTADDEALMTELAAIVQAILPPGSAVWGRIVPADPYSPFAWKFLFAAKWVDTKGGVWKEAFCFQSDDPTPRVARARRAVGELRASLEKAGLVREDENLAGLQNRAERVERETARLRRMLKRFMRDRERGAESGNQGITGSCEEGHK